MTFDGRGDIHPVPPAFKYRTKNGCPVFALEIATERTPLFYHPSFRP